MAEEKRIVFEKAGDLPPMAMSLGLMSVNKTGNWRNERPIIDYDKCVGCMICWKFCPDVSIYIEDDKPVINYDYCKGCGICVEECPVDAIYTEKEGK